MQLHPTEPQYQKHLVEEPNLKNVLLSVIKWDN